MVWSSRDPIDGGYATVSAMIIALAMALAASAVVAASLESYRQAQADSERLRSSYGLAAAQTHALATLLVQRRAGRYRWQVDSPIGSVEVLAEPEQPKLALAAAADLDDAALTRLDVVDPARLRDRLAVLATTGGPALTRLRQADLSPLWRACIGSLVSPFGTSRTDGNAPDLSAAIAPGPGHFDWRAGEIWRLRLISAQGWAEDRIVRLTGDERNPAAVIERRVYRDRPGGDPCAALYS